MERWREIYTMYSKMLIVESIWGFAIESAQLCYAFEILLNKILEQEEKILTPV